MHLTLSSSQRHPTRAGFSLIEVTLALAIAALGFITLLGLLPQGLDMARRSANLASEARIVQKLSGELQSTGWDKIPWKGYGPVRYFNDQATEILESELGDPDVAFSIAYVASVYVPEDPLDLRLPSGSGTKTAAVVAPQDYARRMGIAIASSNRQGFQFNDDRNERLITVHPVIVARMSTD